MEFKTNEIRSSIPVLYFTSFDLNSVTHNEPKYIIVIVSPSKHITLIFMYIFSGLHQTSSYRYYTASSDIETTIGHNWLFIDRSGNNTDQLLTFSI